MAEIKTPKQIARHMKGIANHHRIAIILLIASEPKITLREIAERLSANEKTIGEHTRRLTVAGLINKNYKGNSVEHTLSPYGKMIVKFIKTFQIQEFS